MPASVLAQGQVEGVREVEVRTRVTGILQTVDFCEGARVGAGDLLFPHRPAPYQAAAALARAQLAQETARLAQARSEAGQLGPAELLEARRRLAESRLVVARLRFERAVAHADLCRALEGADPVAGP